MKLIGVKTTIWLIFILTLIILFFIIFIFQSFFENKVYYYSFIIIGIIISAVQFAVALTNYTKKYNFITKTLLKIYNMNH